MLHYQNRLMEALKAIGKANAHPVKIKPFGGELTLSLLVQESHQSPLLLLALREAKNIKNDEVQAVWTIFVVTAQAGQWSPAQHCLLVASLLAEALPDQELDHVEQTPIACELESLPTDFSKPALSVLALNVAVHYPSFLFKPQDLKALEEITLFQSAPLPGDRTLATTTRQGNHDEQLTESDVEAR